MTGDVDGLTDEVEGRGVRVEVRSESALIAEPGRESAFLEHALERMVDLDAPLQCFVEAGGADRGDHEFLDVDVRVGMGSAVEDVHHRHGHDVRVRSAEVAVEGQISRDSCGAGYGQRGAEHRVRTDAGLVVGAVEFDERLVDETLIVAFESDDDFVDFVDDGVDGLGDALAQVALRISVAQLHGFELTGGGAGGNAGTTDGLIGQQHFHLDGGISPGIQDFTGVCGNDLGH